MRNLSNSNEIINNYMIYVIHRRMWRTTNAGGTSTVLLGERPRCTTCLPRKPQRRNRTRGSRLSELSKTRPVSGDVDLFCQSVKAFSDGFRILLRSCYLSTFDRSSCMNQPSNDKGCLWTVKYCNMIFQKKWR